MSRYDDSYGDAGYGASDDARRRKQNNLRSGSNYSRSHNDARRVSSGNSQRLQDANQYPRYQRSSSYESYRQQTGSRRVISQDVGYAQGQTQRRQSAQQGRYAQGQAAQGHRSQANNTSYSRFNSQERYATAARKRTSTRDPRSGMAGSRNYTQQGKSGGFSLANLGVRIPFVGLGNGARGSSNAGRLTKGVNLSAVRGPVIGIVFSAVVVIVAILLWSNRLVDITFNGETTQVRVGSTIQQVIETAEFETTPGDLISVGGKKLESDQGYAFLFKLNDEEQDGEATEAYRVSEGDAITLENGRDRTEDYDVQVVQEQPTLEMGGDAWGNISYISQWPKAGSYEMRTGKISGETARGDTVEETQNCIVTVHQISPDDGRKLVCLTFDDGPASGYTEQYLEILNKYGIHATFFNLGTQVEEYPDLAKKIVEQGSEIMSHTNQHQQLSTLDADALQAEFSDAFSSIQSLVGVSTTSFRPPYGDFTEGAWLKSGGLASVSVLWNLDSEDWRRVSVESIVSKSTSGAFSGAIILMHDGGGNRDMDVEALPQIIETLQAEGYEFVTVTELMKSDSSIPEDIANGDATMPDGCTWPAQLTSEVASTDSTTASE